LNVFEIRKMDAVWLKNMLEVAKARNKAEVRKLENMSKK